MTPCVADRGHSFVGAGKYYLHDRNADTSERVLFTQTLNLATNDPEKAMRYMAYTAMNGERRKLANGGKGTGRQSTEGVVYAFSLSWHPDQKPSEGEMLKAACGAIDALRLAEHEMVIVGHGDTDHPHVHVIVNLVHPESGKIANIYKDHNTLSAWAYDYEKADGEVLCKEREKRYGNDGEGSDQVKKHREHAQERAVLLSRLYDCAKDYSDFMELLRGEGMTLAQGAKGRLVVVDATGDMINLARSLPKGINKKQILERFAGLEVARLPDAEAVAEQCQSSAPGNEVSQEKKLPASDKQKAPCKEQSAPHDIRRAAIRQMQQESAYKALVARRGYQQWQAQQRGKMIHAVVSAYVPREHKAQWDLPAVRHYGHAVAALKHYSAKLAAQPVRMVQRIGQQLRDYSAQVVRLWRMPRAPDMDVTLGKTDAIRHDTPLQQHHSINTRHHELERSIGRSREDDDYGIEL